MIDSETRIWTLGGQPMIRDILGPTDYHTVLRPTADKLIEVRPGTASYEVSCPKEIMKIETRDQSVWCDSAQKFFVGYGLYGVKIVQASELAVGDKILGITENHYYSYYQSEDPDADIHTVSEIEITRIETMISEHSSKVFFKTYVQDTRNFVANSLILIC